MKAIDLDGSSPNNQISYRIQNGASDKFIIGAETGVISIAKGASLDPDLTLPKKLHYSLNVVALDGAPGENQLHAAVTVNITIRDVNNKNPVFLEPNKIVIVKENTPVGAIVATMKAKDLDSSSVLKYKINGDSCEARNEQNILLKSSHFNCTGSFHLDANTGVVTIAKQLDREVVEMISISVIVEDVASETGQQIDKSKY